MNCVLVSKSEMDPWRPGGGLISSIISLTSSEVYIPKDSSGLGVA
jgi:hypothetical protein